MTAALCSILGITSSSECLTPTWEQYATRVVSFVKALENISIVPVFFIDGPPGSNQADFEAKFSELKSRYLKKLELGATIQQICDGKNDLLQAK